MGMSASQARLLQLTAMVHDIEYKAQSIESMKIQLATQEDELYQRYCDALDAKKIQVAFVDNAEKVYVDATYSTMCGYNELRNTQYALRNNRTNEIIVSSQEKEMYEKFGNDKYAFAYAMIGFRYDFGRDEAEGGCQIGVGNYDGINDKLFVPTPDGTKSTGVMTEAERAVYDEVSGSDNKLVNLYDNISTAETDAEQAAALKTFREALYADYASKIFEQMNKSKDAPEGDDDKIYPDKTWDNVKNEFNYYVNLWEAIDSASGCTEVDPTCVSGDGGKTWFNNMVNSGIVTIMAFKDDKDSWDDTSVATSFNGNNLIETQDSANLKKIEAEYEHEMKVINRKDTEYDNELKKLETERTALTTEMESIQEVRDKNIERTFGIFS